MQLLVQPNRNRPAEFARCPRCPPGACQRRLLPLPVSVMLIFKCFLVQVGNFISYGVCKFAFLGSPLGHPKGVPCAELSPQVTEGLPATTANRFHKELRFFFSLLKRKKEAKKEKSSHSTCTVRQCITRRLHKELRHSTTLRCMSSITKLPARFRAGSFVFCRLYASEFFCEGTAYKLVSHAGIYSWCRIYKS